MIQEFDDALARYQLTNQLPQATLIALNELRLELLMALDDSSDAVGSIRFVTFEKGGNAGVVAVLFQVNTNPANYWKFELRYTLETVLDIVFQRVGDYQTANWKECIEISIT